MYAMLTARFTRDNSLDFVRGIAILFVLGAHLPYDAAKGTLAYHLAFPGRYAGWIGVDLFFVLSGFLIGGLLMREVGDTGKVDARRFLVRRAYKILPNYLVYVLLAGVFLNPHRAKQVIPNFLHLQNYLGTPLAHTWSLAVEEHFYLLLVFAIWQMTKRNAVTYRNVVRLCLAAIAVPLAIRSVWVPLGMDRDLVFHSTHTRIDTLALGILMAAVCRFEPERFQAIAQKRALLTAVAVGALAFVFSVEKYGPWMSTFGYDIIALGSAATLMLFVTSVPGVGVLGKARQTKLYGLVASLGVYSYGVYLWHRTGVPVWNALGHRLHLSETAQWYIGSAFYAVAGITAGVLMTKLIEFPALALRERKAPTGVAGGTVYRATVAVEEARETANV